MIINYEEVYLNLNIKINNVSENKQAKLTKSILKLQEWFSMGAKRN